MAAIRAAAAWLTTKTGLLVVSAVAVGVAAGVTGSRILMAITVVPLALALALVAASLGTVAQGLQRVAGRAGQLEHRSGAMNERIANTRSALTARIDAEQARIDHLHASVDGVVDDLGTRGEAVHQRMAALEHQVETVEAGAARHDEQVIDRLRRLEVRVTQLDRDLWRAIAAERSTRSLLLARRSAVPALDRVVVMMTLHRSGSTRLYDLVRSHPGVVLDPSMRTWDALDWVGRRYPAALSDRPDGRVAIEVDHGVGALVPEIGRDGQDHDGPEWIIEKGHPQFVEFDAERFAAAIEALRAADIDVEVLYGVRDPLDAMWSMVSYQRRDPRWYAVLETAEVPEWIARSLEAMVQMKHRIDGLVVDYRSHDDPAFLYALAKRLDPNWTDTDVDRWIDDAIAALDPSGRAEGGGVFVGEANGDRGPAGPDGVWGTSDIVLERARAAYRELTDR